ncbi:DNA-3-methyladenine glycosylase [bacterium]|nr:DNA-3-methyladenine glycosylase [bacterium]
MPQKLPISFYRQHNVVDIAQQLIGKRLCTHINGGFAGGLISETEAYEGVTDKASHAYGGRYTKRTQTMYKQGGIAYVYLCYGMYHLFNVVTHEENVPHAVLIRAILPETGLDLMKERRGRNLFKNLTDGPGKMSKALGISTQYNEVSLLGNEIWIEETDLKIPENEIIAGPRIGIDYAEEHKDLPYRFLWKRGRGV